MSFLFSRRDTAKHTDFSPGAKLGAAYCSRARADTRDEPSHTAEHYGRLPRRLICSAGEQAALFESPHFFYSPSRHHDCWFRAPSCAFITTPDFHAAFARAPLFTMPAGSPERRDFTPRISQVCRCCAALPCCQDEAGVAAREASARHLGRLALVTLFAARKRDGPADGFHCQHSLKT